MKSTFAPCCFVEEKNKNKFYLPHTNFNPQTTEYVASRHKRNLSIYYLSFGRARCSDTGHKNSPAYEFLDPNSVLRAFTSNRGHALPPLN